MGGFKYLLYRLEASAQGSMRFDVACPEHLHQQLLSSLPVRAVRQVDDAAGCNLIQVTYAVPTAIAHQVHERVKVLADDYFDTLYEENPWYDFLEKAVA